MIVRFDLVDPVVSHVLGAVFAEPDVDEEVGVFLARLEVWNSLLRAEFVVYRVAKKGRCLPTTKGAGALGFVIEGRSQGDDAEDLYGSCLSAFVRGAELRNSYLVWAH